MGDRAVSTMRSGAAAVGTTFVELMVAISVVAVALMVMLSQISISCRETSINEDRAFAYRKAMAMLTEVQNGVERGDIPRVEDLDALADLTDYNPNLTTLASADGVPFAPDHPMSGNIRRQGQWRWGRILEVATLPMQSNLRYVKARVFRRRDTGTYDQLALSGALVSLHATAYQPTQHLDLYLLAIDAAPSLWLPLGSAQALIDSARVEMQTIENGLKLRPHWITKLGYGRDPSYVPFVNAEAAADAAAPAAYWYPGLIDGAAPLFAPEAFSGRVRTESALLHDYDATANPSPHAVADQFNHCLRAPQARALFEARVAAGLESADAPPLQVLLEDLWTDPERYRNAIFVNLHGSGLPLPPLRNYSDAAKEPTAHPGVRVVAHPAKLWTRRDPTDPLASEQLALRLYAYKTDPDIGPALLNDPITLQIMGVDLTQDVNGSGSGSGSGPPLQIRRLPGGVSPLTGLTIGLDRGYGPFAAAPDQGGLLLPFEMSYEVGYVGGASPYTWIKLYHTPLVAPPVLGKGLPVDQRLYGMEYVPSPVVAGAGFACDLNTVGAGAKNTARWEILLPPRVFDPSFAGGFGGNADRMLTVVTRIGEDFTTGTAWPVAHQPHNVSTTYAWWTAAPAAVPATERFQFQGDPRHNPYLDLVADTSAFAHGYNWHFDDLREPLVDATPNWPCLDEDRLQDGFAAGMVADAPRLLQLLRGGLQTSGGIFVNPAGPVAQALLLGGEIARPGATPGEMPSPVLLHGDFLGLLTPAPVDSVSPAMSASTVQGRHVVVGTGSEPFWAMEWLGELCPDDLYSTWLQFGNLPTGAVPGTFHREPRSTAMLPRLPAGTDFDFPAGATLGLAGGVALFDAGTLAATTMQREEPPTSASTRTAATVAIMQATGDLLPETLPSGWPFADDLVFPGQLPYFGYTANYPKSVAQVLEQYYDFGDGKAAAGALAVEAPSLPQTAFFTVLGLSPATDAEHQTVGIASLMLGLRTFLRGGEPSVVGRIPQLPLVEVIEPVESAVLSNPSSMLLRWKTTFLRFDGQAYTTGYPAGFGEPESDLRYSVLYSLDEGETWRYVANAQLAVPERRPSEPSLLLPDAATGSESLLLQLPLEQYPGADYLFRVECYHAARQCHLSLHQVRVLITR